jgi:hypothetical protein
VARKHGEARAPLRAAIGALYRAHRQMKLIAVKFAPAVVPAVAALKPTAAAIRAMRPAFAVLRAAIAGRFADRLAPADKPEPTKFDPFLLDPDFLAALLENEAKRYDLPPGAWDDLDICRWLAIGQALERRASKAHASARPILDRPRDEVLRKRGAPRGPRKK